jgi:hypothetical protein
MSGVSGVDTAKRERVASPQDGDLLASVMRVYLPHSRYLKAATVDAPAGTRAAGVTATGEFEIGDACYIDETGHFNAVEFNICYNQLAYYLIAKSVQERLLPVFDGWDLADFRRLQLPNILITDFRSTFRRRMLGERFSGAVTVAEATRLARSRRWNALVVLRTTCRFWDAAGGDCRGEVKLAITDPEG